MSERLRIQETLGWGIAQLGAMVILGAAAIFGYRVFEWLRWGASPLLNVDTLVYPTGYGRPEFQWIGVQKIWDQLAGLPIDALVFFVGMGIAGVGMKMSNSALEQLRDIDRASS